MQKSKILTRIESALTPLSSPSFHCTAEMIYPNGFKNQLQFSKYLVEGNLLNITTIASKALSIPAGEYMVWVSDVGHTMLIPTTNNAKSEEVFEYKTHEYDILTPTLLKHWNQVQKVVMEDDDNSDTQFKADKTNIKRKAMYQAMENNGYANDYGALAAKVGVQTPMISRILSGDRTPSMGTASQICAALSSDPAAIFPDIFDIKSSKYRPKKVKGNRGSGSSSLARSTKKGEATKKWTQGGNPNESIQQTSTIIELDSPIDSEINIEEPPKDQNIEQSTTDQNIDIKRQIDPQLQKAESDIDELEDLLNQGRNNANNTSQSINDIETQLNSIDNIINKISSQIE